MRWRQKSNLFFSIAIRFWDISIQSCRYWVGSDIYYLQLNAKAVKLLYFGLTMWSRLIWTRWFQKIISVLLHHVPFFRYLQNQDLTIKILHNRIWKLHIYKISSTVVFGLKYVSLLSLIWVRWFKKHDSFCYITYRL